MPFRACSLFFLLSEEWIIVFVQHINEYQLFLDGDSQIFPLQFSLYFFNISWTCLLMCSHTFLVALFSSTIIFSLLVVVFVALRCFEGNPQSLPSSSLPHLPTMLYLFGVVGDRIDGTPPHCVHIEKNSYILCWSTPAQFHPSIAMWIDWLTLFFKGLSLSTRDVLKPKCDLCVRPLWGGRSFCRLTPPASGTWPRCGAYTLHHVAYSGYHKLAWLGQAG